MIFSAEAPYLRCDSGWNAQKPKVRVLGAAAMTVQSDWRRCDACARRPSASARSHAPSASGRAMFSVLLRRRNGSDQESSMIQASMFRVSEGQGEGAAFRQSPQYRCLPPAKCDGSGKLPAHLAAPRAKQASRQALRHYSCHGVGHARSNKCPPELIRAIYRKL